MPICEEDRMWTNRCLHDKRFYFVTQTGCFKNRRNLRANTADDCQKLEGIVNSVSRLEETRFSPFHGAPPPLKRRPYLPDAQASSGLRLQDCKIRIAFLFGGLHLDLKSIKKEDLIADWIASNFRFCNPIRICNPFLAQ